MIYNNDDRLVKDMEFPKNRSLSFGFGDGASVWGTILDNSIRIEFQDKPLFTLRPKFLPGDFHLQNLLATVALGLALGISPAMLKTLEDAHLPSLHFELYSGEL